MNNEEDKKGLDPGRTLVSLGRGRSWWILKIEERVEKKGGKEEGKRS